MTDAEPEPFRMSTGSDDERDGDELDTDPSAESPETDAAPDTESISDLIDEASRTAAEQAEREAAGTAPEDQSADVWGRPPDDEDELDAVWSAAAERHRGSHVFDDMLGTEESWSSPTRGTTTPAAPTPEPTGAAAPAEDEPDVFKLSIGDDGTAEDEPVPDERVPDEPLSAAPPATEATPTTPAPAPGDEPTPGDEPAPGVAPAEPARAATAPAEDAWAQDDDAWAQDDDAWAQEDDTSLPDDEAWGPVLEDADDAWAAADGTDGDDPWSAAGEGGDEPEPFQFEAGPQTSAPAQVPDHVDLADDEPDLFAFAFEDVDEPGDDAAPEAAAVDAATHDEHDEHDEDDGPVTFDLGDDEPVRFDLDDLHDLDDAPLAVDDDEEEDDEDDGPATFDLGDDEPVTFALGDDEDDEDEVADEPPLAETARPRPDAGWEDQSAPQDSWALDGVTAPRSDDAADDGFVADDEPISSHDPDPPFQTESQALGDVLDDLLGGMDAPAADDDPATAAAFEDLDGMPPPSAATRATDAPPAAAPVSDAPAPAAVDDEVADGPDGLDHLDDLVTPTPAPAVDEPPDVAAAAADETDGDDEDDEDDAAATPTPPTAPAALSFSSKPKKRGLFRS